MNRLIAALVVWFGLMTPTFATAERIDHLTGLAPADHVKLNSEIVGRPYHIFVRLPEDYHKTDKLYPTVYLLDGDIAFPIFGAYHLLLSYDEPVPDAIIVGVSYGTFDRDNGNFRGVDYSTPPLPDNFRQGVDDGGKEGGAARFQNFLSEELIPRIEADYRSDASRRILVGQSRGAHFVLYSALNKPDLFWGRIASNPSLKPNKEFFFQDLNDIEPAQSHLFFTSGARDYEDLRKEALELFDHWSKQETTPWRLEMRTLEDETHAAGFVRVYRAGMKWLFPGAEKENQSYE